MSPRDTLHDPTHDPVLRVQVSGFGFGVLRFIVYGLGLRVENLGFGVWGLGFRVQGLRFKFEVQGLGG